MWYTNFICEWSDQEWCILYVFSLRTCIFYCLIGLYLQNTNSKRKLLALWNRDWRALNPVWGPYKCRALYTFTAHMPVKLALQGHGKYSVSISITCLPLELWVIIKVTDSEWKRKWFFKRRGEWTVERQMQQMFTMGIEDKGELSVLFSASIKYQRVVQPKGKWKFYSPEYLFISCFVLCEIYLY